jgi:hypothetical protein
MVRLPPTGKKRKKGFGLLRMAKLPPIVGFGLFFLFLFLAFWGWLNHSLVLGGGGGGGGGGSTIPRPAVGVVLEI